MWTSGCATRFSTTTNAAKAAMAAAMQPSTNGEFQPRSPPLPMNRIIPATVTAIRAAPTQSIRPGGRLSRFVVGHRFPGKRYGGDSNRQSQDEDGAISEVVDQVTAEQRIGAGHPAVDSRK